MKGYKLFYCRSNDQERRLDRVVKKMLPDIPAGLIYSSIRKGTIRVNGKKSCQSYRIQEDDVIAVKETIQHSSSTEKPVPENSGSKADLDSITVLRTDNLVFINKPSGMLTHGSNSLAELLPCHLVGIEDSLSFKPAPLHRLDRNTSGLITISASIKGAARFSKLMQQRKIRKYYLGVCINGPAEPIRLVDSLERSGNITRKASSGTDNDSKTGITEVEPLCSTDNLTLCLFRIETGLTHQIRSQAAAAGFPLAGDSKYGGRRTKDFKRYILHSWAMVLPEYDDICGFRSVFADLPSGQLKILSGIWGKSHIDSALQKAKSKIISI